MSSVVLSFWIILISPHCKQISHYWILSRKIDKRILRKQAQYESIGRFIFNTSDAHLIWAGFLICFAAECDEYIRIFWYSNTLGTNIYLDIRSGQFCLYQYIWTFVGVKYVCMNIFRHSFMSVLESENRPNIRIYSNIRTIFNTNIYSDIRSCQIFYTNIFGHSFV